MKLPNAKALIVEQEKIADYLLNPAHRYGASKARFFVAFGFRVAEWQRLAQAFREHGQTQAVARLRATGFGPRYEVEGPLRTPDGRRPLVRTVWQLDKGAVDHRVSSGGKS